MAASPDSAPTAVPAGGAAVTTDVVIVGAGPVGLFQVFELGLQDLRAHVIDSLPVAGGQCIELYADKPIYDIPGTPVCTGRELIERLGRQIAPFDAQFHLSQVVDAVEPLADGRFLVTTDRGTRLSARAVIIAAGVGSFQPRRLPLDGLEAFEGVQVFHGPGDDFSTDARRILVLGDGAPAVEFAVRHALGAAEVTLMHRRDDFKAPPAVLATLRQMVGDGRMRLLIGQATGLQTRDGRLGAVTVAAADGLTVAVELDALVVHWGLSPKLGPIAHWGLELQRKQLVVDTQRFETNVPGIHAVGDVNTYPGKRKLILCGFHEATLAAFAVAQRIRPDQPVRLEYTTTSARLHRALGVQVEG